MVHLQHLYLYPIITIAPATIKRRRLEWTGDDAMLFLRVSSMFPRQIYLDDQLTYNYTKANFPISATIRMKRYVNKYALIVFYELVSLYELPPKVLMAIGTCRGDIRIGLDDVVLYDPVVAADVDDLRCVDTVPSANVFVISVIVSTRPSECWICLVLDDMDT